MLLIHPTNIERQVHPHLAHIKGKYCRDLFTYLLKKLWKIISKKQCVLSFFQIATTDEKVIKLLLNIRRNSLFLSYNSKHEKIRFLYRNHVVSKSFLRVQLYKRFQNTKIRRKKVTFLNSQLCVILVKKTIVERLALKYYGSLMNLAKYNEIMNGKKV